MAAIKYLIDEQGEKTSVLVPVKIWNDLNERFEKLQKKLQVISQLKAGIKEVANARRSGKQLQSLQDFLNEG